MMTLVMISFIAGCDGELEHTSSAGSNDDHLAVFMILEARPAARPDWRSLDTAAAAAENARTP